LKKRIQPHLRLGEGDVEAVAFIAGDPNRVPRIAEKMKDPVELSRHRGLVSYRAHTPGGVGVTVATSGMGTPSTLIVVEELAKLGAKCIIRIGTCGGVNPQMNTGDVLIPYGAVRDDLCSTNYAPLQYPAVASPEVYQGLLASISTLLPASRVRTGIVWATDIYYDRRDGNPLDLWTRCGVQGIEMESSLLFVFAQTQKIKAGSILACDGNLHRDPKLEQKDESEKSGEQSPLLVEAVDKEIEAAIRAVDSLYSAKGSSMGSHELRSRATTALGGNESLRPEDAKAGRKNNR
jgi:uridine phosphorylase